MKISRRHFVATTGSMGFCGAFGNRLAAATPKADSKAPFKQCVVLWMEGGPSHIDTFIPAANNQVATSIGGMSFAPSLTDFTDHAEDLCVLKTIGGREGEHLRATSLLHTGFSPSPSFPRPSFGSMVSHASEDSGLPRYVTLGGRSYGPAFLGVENGPFVLGDPAAAIQQIERLTRRTQDLDALQRFNLGHRERSSEQARQVTKQRDASIESVRRLIKTDFGKALDPTLASPGQRDAYGDEEFGQRVLIARRLLEIGVPMVEVQLPGWDTHVDNQRTVDRLCKRLVPPWAALIDDLQRSSAWEQTLVVWLGEFGRTPTINASAGRDHYPQIIPVVLGGGALGGRVIGGVDEKAAHRVGQQHSVADLMATLLTLMGLDCQKEYTTDFGSPTTATDGGTPIAEVVKLVA